MGFVAGFAPGIGRRSARCVQLLRCEAADGARWNPAVVDMDEIVSQVKFDKNGLVPAIAQQYDTGEVLMMAYMNAESIKETLSRKRAVYYSREIHNRSRQALWRKGDTSGQFQQVHDFKLDCDGDTILLSVDQLGAGDQPGVACHTGRRSCFYFAVRDTGLEDVLPVLVDPDELYKKGGTHKHTHPHTHPHKH